ncbi:homing endonuclease associated repeat-containing protein [Natronorubrum sp. A-ect3]|uniref:homing endonuclease associated repeat-containing protein n=1 Tax=Natronorubrum sp. A-ect3 TaxID=3242698 RepID=UPI00359E1A7F
MPAPVSEDELLQDIRRVHHKLGKTPSENDYDEHGDYSSSAVRREFGKYTAGREKAGLPEIDMRGGQNKILRSELVDALHELADNVGGTPTRDQMEEYGKYSEGAYRNEFDSWNAALRELGYEPNRPTDPETVEASCQYCESEEERLASSIQNQDRVFCSPDCLNDWRSEHFCGEDHPLYHRVEVECDVCGKIKIRRPSIVTDREHHFCDSECYSEWCSFERTGENHPRWKGGGDVYYGPNWQRQRRKRLQIDGFQCQRCSLTREESLNDLNRGLSVHHRTPVRSFYEESERPNWESMNSVDNLVTLCLGCHRTVESWGIQPQTVSQSQG